MPSDKNAYNKNIIDTHAIIDAFGGIRPMAQKLNIAASTIQGWKARNNIPMARLDEIIKIAARDNINISLNNNDEDIIKLSDVIDGEVEVTKKTVSVEKPIILDDKSDNSKATATKESLYDSNISKSIATKETVSKSNNNHSNKLSWLAIILFVILAAAMVMHSIWSPITDKLITKYTFTF